MKKVLLSIFICLSLFLGATPCTPPSISGQPSGNSQTLCSGDPVAALSVAAAGSGLSYQWYSNSTSSNSGGNPISGANSASYTPSNTLVGTTYYYVVVSGTCGPASVTSTVSGGITVNQRSTAPTSASASQGTICYGSNTTLSYTGTLGTGSIAKWYAGSCGGGASVGTGNGLLVFPTTTTTYYVRFEDPAPCSNNTGCQSTTVTVKQVPTATQGSTTSATVCANSGSYTISGYTATNGTILWSAMSTSGTAGSISNATSQTPTYNFSAADVASGATVTLTMTVSNSPCNSASTTFSLSIKAVPIATPGATTHADQCASLGSYTVPAGYSASFGTIAWTASTTSTITNATSLTPTYDFSTGEINTTTDVNVTLTLHVSDGGVCPAASANFTLTIKPSPRISFSHVDSSPCLTGNLFSFVVTNPNNVYTSYQWTFGAALNHPPVTTGGSTLSNIHFNNPGVNQPVMVKGISALCYALDTFNINVYPMPDSSFALNNDSLPFNNLVAINLCGDTSVSFRQLHTTYTNTSILIWGDGSTTAGPTASHLYPTTPVTSTYTLTFIPRSDHGCIDTNRGAVTIYPLPTATFTEDTTSHHCRATNSFQFTDNSFTNNTLTRWRYNFGDGGNSNSSTPVHSYSLGNSSTSYTVTETVWTNHGCSASFSRGLTVYANPVQVVADSSGGAHGRGDTLCGSTSAALWDMVSNGTRPYVSYRWYDGNNNTLSSSDTLHLPALNADMSVNYTVVVTDHEGCTDTLSKRIQYFPNPAYSDILGADTVCRGSQNISYHIQHPQDSVHYVWDVSGIPQQVISQDTVAEISFPASGSSGLVLAYATNSPYRCTVIDTQRVIISAQSAPTASVLLNTSSSGTDSILICSNSGVTAYQWGYDNRSSLQSTTISGETQQALILGAPLPSASAVYYWVAVGSGSCVSKIYLSGDAPSAIVNVAGTDIHISAYPNPFSDMVRLDISEDQAREWTADVYDISGRKVYTLQSVSDRYTPIEISTRPWAAGMYSIHVHSDAGGNAVLPLIKE